MRPVRVGYHRRSDNSVSSGVWEGAALLTYLGELFDNPDVDEVWVRSIPSTTGSPMVRMK